MLNLHSRLLNLLRERKGVFGEILEVEVVGGIRASYPHAHQLKGKLGDGNARSS